MTTTTLWNINEAAAFHGIQPAAILRMDAEGLVAIMYDYQEGFSVRTDDLQRVVALAADMPKLLTCTCVAGPCVCELRKAASGNTMRR